MIFCFWGMDRDAQGPDGCLGIGVRGLLFPFEKGFDFDQAEAHGLEQVGFGSLADGLEIVIGPGRFNFVSDINQKVQRSHRSIASGMEVDGLQDLRIFNTKLVARQIGTRRAMGQGRLQQLRISCQASIMEHRMGIQAFGTVMHQASDPRLFDR